MTISIWRYSHLMLAVSSFIFILIASVTGIILAFEPISNQLKPYSISEIKAIPLTETITVLTNTYEEVISLEIDDNELAIASVVTKEGLSGVFYINPYTGEKVGDYIQKAPIFKFATSLHRSLFLKKIGRFFVGFASFLCFLIALSGVILILKRQGSFRKFFGRVTNENFYQFYHIIFGRLSLIPIIIITITGVYLSLLKFDLLPSVNQKHDYDYTTINTIPNNTINTFPAFKNITLGDVKFVEFPFSTDVEDFYKVELIQKEILVNQITGEIVSEIDYPFTKIAAYYSLIFHTGRGSILWSIVLIIACLSLLFFIVSGFKMTFKRRKAKLKNRYKVSNANIIILVGSETGTTIQFASIFQEQLLKNGYKSFIDELNNYKTYPKASQLIVFTATYGEGEAPVNASRFIEKLASTINENIKYSVVGFGSMAYPDFCKYAYDVDSALKKNTSFKEQLPIATINDKSVEVFENWVKEWGDIYKTTIVIPKDKLVLDPPKTKPFIVKTKTDPKSNPDNTFLISFKPKRKQTFTSGDLLAIYPNNDHKERLYSIGKIDTEIHLSVKLHEFGIGSSFLNNLKENQKIISRIIKNSSFHFPEKASQIVMIANGTGIAPFLGMIDGNRKKIKVNLFWGGRTNASFNLYREILEKASKNQLVENIHVSLSKEGEEQYVQNKIKKNEALIIETLANNGCVMVCGSLNMKEGVFAVLEEICKSNLKTSLDFYINNKQIRTDCY